MIAFFLAYLRGFSFFWLFELLIVFFFLKPFLGWVAISSFRSVIPFLHPPPRPLISPLATILFLYIYGRLILLAMFFLLLLRNTRRRVFISSSLYNPRHTTRHRFNFCPRPPLFLAKNKIDLNIFSDIICSPWLPSIPSAVGSKVVDDIYPYSLTY